MIMHVLGGIAAALIVMAVLGLYTFVVVGIAKANDKAKDQVTRYQQGGNDGNHNH